MLPLIAAGVSLLVVGGAAVYKYTTSRGDKPSKDGPTPRSLGTFVFWGRPNVGKTTLIARIRGLNPDPGAKVSTSTQYTYLNVNLSNLQDGPYCIDKIVDMPGHADRFKDWLAMVATDAHVFYMIDLSRIEDRAYESRIQLDVAEAMKTLAGSTKKTKRLNIIASHVDVSKWGGRKDSPDLDNILQGDPEIRALHESMGDVAGYIYSVDLTNKDSFQKLLQCIVNDCQN